MRFLRPDWSKFSQDHLNWMLRQPAPVPTAAPIPRGSGPGKPRPAEVADLLKAVWGIPSVQNAANRVLDDVTVRLRGGWTAASNAERALFISHSALIAGSALSAAMADSRTRTGLLNFVSGTDIPVPGIEGLCIQLRHDSRKSDYGGVVTFDLTPYVWK